MLRQSATPGSDFDDASRVRFSGGCGNLRQNCFGGEEVLAELAGQALSLEHVATLMNRTSFEDHESD